MLTKRAFLRYPLQCKAYTTAPGPRPVPLLSNATLNTFRQEAFTPSTPALLPRHSLTGLPAIQKWFVSLSDKSQPTTLNREYLYHFGDTIVPLEITDNGQFGRVELAFIYFLDASSTSLPTTRVYLAQASIPDLPQSMQNDLPTPDIVLHAGKGDVYASSIWLGQAPTYTPLHRDPNPNLFVQLAGVKQIRLFKPEIGRAIFAKVQERIGGRASATMRGEEMMQGMEREALEKEVWAGEGEFRAGAWEAEVESGDALFIPKGWWHSVKGVGEGMTGSVNWWFR